MKATLETVTGITINRDIDTAESPMGIIVWQIHSFLNFQSYSCNLQ